MNDVATALDAMLEAGVPRQVIVEAIAKMVDAIPRVEGSAERRRRLDRERKRRVRAEAEMSAQAAECPQMSAKSADIPQNLRTEADSAEAPHARVEEPPSEVVLYNPTLPDLGAGAFENPDRETLDALEARLIDAVGVALGSKAVCFKLWDLSPILGMLKSGQGPPADLEMDVLPTLRAAAARSSPGSIKTWAYFTGAIREARDRRLTGAPKVIPLEPRHERPDAPSAKRAAREGNYARAFNGALAAAHSRGPV